MQHRRNIIVAAFTGLLLVDAGGCARSESHLQRRNAGPEFSQSPARDDAAMAKWHESPTDDTASGQLSPQPSDDQVDPRLDEAFQRLQQAKAKMPRHLPSATSRQVPRPPTRIASPFAIPEGDRVR